MPSFRRTFTGYPSPVSLAHEPDSAEPIWKTRAACRGVAACQVSCSSATKAARVGIIERAPVEPPVAAAERRWRSRGGCWRCTEDLRSTLGASAVINRFAFIGRVASAVIAPTETVIGPPSTTAAIWSTPRLTATHVARSERAQQRSFLHFAFGAPLEIDGEILLAVTDPAVHVERHRAERGGPERAAGCWVRICRRCFRNGGRLWRGSAWAV